MYLFVLCLIINADWSRSKTYGINSLYLQKFVFLTCTFFQYVKKKKVLPQRVRQSRVGFRAGDELRDTRIEISIFAAWISWYDTLLIVPGGVRQLWRVGTMLGKVLRRAYLCARKSLCAQVCVRICALTGLAWRALRLSVKESISTLFQLAAPVELNCLGHCRV